MAVFICFVLSWLLGLFLGWECSELKSVCLWTGLAAQLVGILLLFRKRTDLGGFPDGLLVILATAFFSGFLTMEIQIPKTKLKSGPAIYEAQVMENRAWGQESRISVKLLATWRDSLREPIAGRALIKMGRQDPDLGIKGNNRIVFQGSFEELEGRTGFGVFSEKVFWRASGIRYVTSLQPRSIYTNENLPDKPVRAFQEHAAYIFRQAIREMPVSQKHQGILLAMLLGNKTNLESTDKELFSRLGIIHLMAVSGLHVGLIFFLASALLRLFGFSKTSLINLFLSNLLAWGYAFLCGLPPSAARAVAMLNLYSISRGMSRPTGGVHLVFLVAFLHTLFVPTVIFSLGFQLSYLAILGILIFYRQLVKQMPVRSIILQKARDLIAISISAQVLTLPITLLVFGRFPVYFLVSNLLLMPMGLGIFYLGILLLFLEQIHWQIPWMGKILSALMDSWLFLGDQIAQLPGSVLILKKYPTVFILLFLIVLLWIGISGKRILARPLPLLILFVVWSLHGFLAVFFNNL